MRSEKYDSHYIRYQEESDAFILVMGAGNIALGQIYRNQGRGSWKYQRFNPYRSNDWVRRKIQNRVAKMNRELKKC